jgi:hypothetical protein
VIERGKLGKEQRQLRDRVCDRRRYRLRIEARCGLASTHLEADHRRSGTIPTGMGGYMSKWQAVRDIS